MLINELSQLQSAASWVSKKTPVVCVNIIQETPDVKTFQFQSIESQLFHFKPGQFIGLQVEITNSENLLEKHNRSYTIASSPSRPHLLDLTIKKENGGVVSPWLHENIQIGSQLELRGPAGRFNNLDITSNINGTDKALLISAGSGITPTMSMARFWTDTQPSKNIRFLNWVHSVEDIIFRRELALLDHKNDLFNLEVICTQPGLSENWLGRRGRINSTVLKDMVSDINDRVVFCCGPEGFMEQVKSSLNDIGFNMEHYHDESFDPGGKKKAKRAANVQNKVELIKPVEIVVSPIYTLKLKKSNLELDVKPNDILLEKLEEANVDIASSCRGGNCGACHVKKISGETTTETNFGLTDENKREGRILTCTTKLLSNVELDI
jgi:ferredoxin-NADP reductase